MHEARALGVAETQAVEEPVDVPLGRGAALDREPRRLVEDDDRLVPVQDRRLQYGRVRRPRLRSHGPGRQRQLVRRKADRLTRTDPVTGPRPLAVDADPPGAEQFFELPVPQTGIMPFEPAVEAETAESGHSDTAARWRSLSQ